MCKKITNYFIFLVCIMLLLMIGFSSFKSSLSIVGDALIRFDYDLRISNVELVSKNNVEELKENSFTKNSVGFNIKLNDSSSNIKYKVTITNKSSKYFTPGEFAEVLYDNKNVKYEISNLMQNGVYQGNSYDFYITFTTSSSNQIVDCLLKFNLALIDSNVWNFDFTGTEQVFNVLYDADYILEVWGAQGGWYRFDTVDGTTIYNQNNLDSGYGGYAVGEVSLKNLDVLHIYVGKTGYATTAATFNGGGPGDKSGAGATHIALKTGLLSELSDSISDILIVAGGGGGASDGHIGGHGGGYIGGSGNYNAGQSGGTQSAGGSLGTVAGYSGGAGSFGQGGTGVSSDPGPGGGGGFYGGGGVGGQGTGGGGSGYIGNSLLKNKAMYCFECSESTDVSTKTISVSDVSTDATSMYAKMGNGYAKITVIPSN